jgi:predicted nucleic acid-binding protein
MIVYLDTNCIIYLVEQNPVWGPKVVKRLADLRQAGNEISTSDLTRTECLAHPFAAGNAALVADDQTLFSGSQVRMLPLTVAVCERAAQLRAASGFRLKVPDCLHLAAAIEHGCELFLTNDADLATCRQVPVEILT